ncbi:uncharacterized protein METZ01_LOCUS220136 [marine metagenome]|uniref:Uncharacterized protein n=1 Tax=marine metagenome TaxID=408172 RepID=A0A382FXE4_9ZZZZ|tara:strand:- start:305 stop:466 length:162 start_codon:yes stop_codon:yes gene_type:complete
MIFQNNVIQYKLTLEKPAASTNGQVEKYFPHGYPNKKPANYWRKTNSYYLKLA